MTRPGGKALTGGQAIVLVTMRDLNTDRYGTGLLPGQFRKRYIKLALS
jgi:hypothetical protein